jgi:hypothetical protein
VTGLPTAPRRALRGHAPLVALVAVAAAITTFVPTGGREELARQTTVGASATPGAEGPAPGSGPVAAALPDGTPQAPGTRTPGVPGTAPATACADRPMQVAGDPYSPPCRAFSGDNGGATARGVTADSIVVSWRYTDERALSSAVSSSVGNRVQLTDTADDLRRTVEGLVEYFNRHFQLYGRQIDIRWFQGVGSFQNELLGSGQTQAGADAVTVANDIGAFAEAQGNTATFADALARRQVVSIGLDYLSDEWYQQRRPYVFGAASCTTAAHLAAEYANKRLFGGPATWAGGSLAGKPRRVAVIAPENSYYQECVQTIRADLAAEGHQLDASLTYALDITTASQDTSAIVASLAADGITTVLCFTDPVSPVFYTAKAEQQDYHPEWIVAGIAGLDADFAGQQYSAPQWRRAFGVRTLADQLPFDATLAYQAFKAARPSEEPSSNVQIIYRNLYELVVGIQQAGPNLTPATFEAGFQSYPGGPGELGTWRGQAGSHTLLRDGQEVWWNPTAVSKSNGQPGSYTPTGPRHEVGALTRGTPAVFK